jgi:hypothetical protein
MTKSSKTAKKCIQRIGNKSACIPVMLAFGMNDIEMETRT